MTEVGNQDTSVAVPPKRRFVWVWVLVLLAVLIAIPRVTSYILVQRAERRVAAAIENLPFKLVPVKDLANTWGPAPKPEDNAAPLVAEACRKAEEILAAPAAEKPEVEGRKSEPLSKEFERLQVIWGLSDASSYPEDEAALTPEELRQNAMLDEYFKKCWANGGGGEITPEVRAALDAKSKRPPPKIPPRDVKRAREFLKHFDEVQKLVDEAARRSAYRRERNWSLLNKTPKTAGDDPTELQDLLLFACSVDVEEGHWDAAYEHIAQTLRLARLMDQEPTLSGLRVFGWRSTTGHYLTKLLARHGPTQAQADELAALIQTDMIHRLRSFVAFECNTTYELTNAMITGRTDGTDPGVAAASGFVRHYHTVDQAVFLESMGRIVRATDLPWRESMAEIAAVSDTSSSQKLAGVQLLASWGFVQGMKMMTEAFYCEDIQDRQFAVAVQVSAYQQAHGHYPEKLADLPHADQLPRDPYTINHVGEIGKPFGYRIKDEGFLIWSVGPEGKDDIVLQVPPENKKPPEPAKSEDKP